jgi:hypothetical protein
MEYSEISVFGHTAWIASENPVRPSTEIINISSVPLFLISFRIPNQYLALSLPPAYISITSLVPSNLMPIAIYTAFFIIVLSCLTL